MPPIFFQHATAGWLALLGLAVPLAIYLWNRRPGRVVQVGSVRWLEAAANRRLRSLKPEQLWLLLLRAAVLGLLALALAEPAQLLPAPPPRGQVLLAPGATGEALTPVRPLLDSLRRQGYELRPLLNAGRPVAWTALDSGLVAPAATPATPPNLWAAVRQATDSLPDRSVVVVAPLTVASFSGSRPALPATVRWLPLPTPDSSAWPVAAWQPHPDSLLLLLAQGTETGVRLRRVRRRWPLPPGPVAGLGLSAGQEVRAAGNQLTITENDSTRPFPLLPSRPLRLLVSYDATHAASARVLTAALRAAGSVLPVRPVLVSQPAPPTPSDSLNWLFWLRTEAVPATWQPALARGLRLWQEAPAAAPAYATTFGELPGLPVRVLRLDTARARSGSMPEWRTASGYALLTRDTSGRRYQLHTRLDPAWSELADSPQLPELLLPLLLPISPGAPAPDSRRLDLAQLHGPRLAASFHPAHRPHRNLAPWLVLAAGLLFALERTLAARSRAAVA